MTTITARLTTAATIQVVINIRQMEATPIMALVVAAVTTAPVVAVTTEPAAAITTGLAVAVTQEQVEAITTEPAVAVTTEPAPVSNIRCRISPNRVLFLPVRFR
jgi:hypothetical protein